MPSASSMPGEFGNRRFGPTRDSQNIPALRDRSTAFDRKLPSRIAAQEQVSGSGAKTASEGRAVKFVNDVPVEKMTQAVIAQTSNLSQVLEFGRYRTAP